MKSFISKRNVHAKQCQPFPHSPHTATALYLHDKAAKARLRDDRATSGSHIGALTQDHLDYPTFFGVIFHIDLIAFSWMIVV